MIIPLDVATGLLLVGVVTAAVTDIHSRKIYNWTTYPGMLIALGLNALDSLLGWDDAVRQISGTIGIQQSAGGFLACGLLMVICFVCFRIGGGDVKLMAMMGAFLGISLGIEAILWSFVLGGAFGLVLLVWRMGVWKLICLGWMVFVSIVRLQGFGHLKYENDEESRTTLFMAPSAAAAVVIVKTQEVWLRFI